VHEFSQRQRLLAKANGFILVQRHQNAYMFIRHYELYPAAFSIIKRQ
jgi:hypothetical protein